MLQSLYLRRTHQTNTAAPHSEDGVRTGNDSQTDSQSESVLTSPSAIELETANVLLQLGTLDSREISKTEGTGEDNALLVPIDREPMEDFTREIRQREEANLDLNSNMTKTAATMDTPEEGTNEASTIPESRKPAAHRSPSPSDSNTDSDKTVNYVDVDVAIPINEASTATPSVAEESGSPKGHLKYRHYGIVRKSPSSSSRKNLHCYYCDVVCHSKREINEHHKLEHTRVQCPDCPLVFPTPDALQRHRYIHQEDHRYKCAICDKVCAFKSDLDMHILKHGEEKRWFCSFKDCDRDFERKSDLTAHEITHSGEEHKCTFPKCTYTNKDPRLVKRHHRVHTQEKTVKCTICPKTFTYYQQMKRHRNRDH